LGLELWAAIGTGRGGRRPAYGGGRTAAIRRVRLPVDAYLAAFPPIPWYWGGRRETDFLGLLGTKKTMASKLSRGKPDI